MKLYSPQDAAKMLGVSYSTISRWVDKGVLKAYKTVGGHRKITHKEVITYIKKNNIDVFKNEPSKKIKALLFEPNKNKVRAYKRVFNKSNFQLESVSTDFQAGTNIVMQKPQVIILDSELQGISLKNCLTLIRTMPELAKTKIIVTSSKNSNEFINNIKKYGADEFIEKPFKANELLDKVKEMI